MHIFLFFFFVLSPSSNRWLATPWTDFLNLSLSSVILIDSSTGVLSTSWCCPSRPCVVFLACMYLTLFLALSLSPGNSHVASCCDQSIIVSLLWQCLKIPSLLQHIFSFGKRYRICIWHLQSRVLYRCYVSLSVNEWVNFSQRLSRKCGSSILKSELQIYSFYIRQCLITS